MPPLAETVAEPLLPPKQVISVVEVIIAVGGGVSFTVSIAVAIHPFESVTVT